MDYFDAFPDLNSVYLEDSWVLDVAHNEHSLPLRLDIVLTPEHPRYEPPKPNEQHCYRLGQLTVRSDDLFEVHLSGNRPAVDATGMPDFGHVDVFAFDPAHDIWRLEGDWGTAVTRSPQVSLVLD